MVQFVFTLAAFAGALSAAVIVVDGRPEFVARLPNGANVPGVDALGHVNPAGGGANNQFGKDFDKAGRKWTKAFCAMDSDGDGQTNGQELGDPCCEWSATGSAKVLWTEGVSHPGLSSKTSDPALWTAVNCSSSSSAANPTDASSDKVGATEAPEKSGNSPANVATSVLAFAVVAVLTLA